MSAQNPDVKLAYNLLNEYCTRDGKRIRPLLLILSYIGYGGDSSAINTLIPVAASLECMHAFLLIQDDIIDGAVLRRGKPAFHKVCDSSYNRYNENIGQWVAIAIADVLMSNAVEMISLLKSSLIPVFLHEFAIIYERTALGQMLDILWANPRNITNDDIPHTIAAMKTAHYTVSGPLRLGYILTGQEDTNELQKLADAGYAIGFAFQMRDDIIGVFGDEQDTGKSSISDIEEGKYTVLLQKTLELLNNTDKTRFTEFFKKKQKSENDILAIKEYIKKSGATEEIQQLIAEHVHKAKTIVQQLQCNDMMKNCMLDFIKSLFG
ncbi:MAG: polyprenyl synthetase family protein [Spirochaetes bacterium]|nr:polyprenyl synthetase family protein [Spirochaetota bacterium]